MRNKALPCVLATKKPVLTRGRCEHVPELRCSPQWVYSVTDSWGHSHPKNESSFVTLEGSREAGCSCCSVDFTRRQDGVSTWEETPVRPNTCQWTLMVLQQGLLHKELTVCLLAGHGFLFLRVLNWEDSDKKAGIATLRRCSLHGAAFYTLLNSTLLLLPEISC